MGNLIFCLVIYEALLCTNPVYLPRHGFLSGAFAHGGPCAHLLLSEGERTVLFSTGLQTLQPSQQYAITVVSPSPPPPPPGFISITSVPVYLKPPPPLLSSLHRRDLFHRVFEMEHAYTVPTLDSSKKSAPDQLPWKQQFSIMVL